VAGLDRRLGEAARLGFAHAVVPHGTGVKAPDGLQLVEAAHIREAVEWAQSAGRGARDEMDSQ
jgi:DNA repair protein RadA/Sms